LLDGTKELLEGLTIDKETSHYSVTSLAKPDNLDEVKAKHNCLIKKGKKIRKKRMSRTSPGLISESL